MARRHGERTVFLPWERQGGLVRRLGLGRIRVAAAVLLGVLVLGMLGHREKKLARERSTRATLLVVRRGIDAYRADHEGKCPKGSFDELVSRGYLAQLPVDAWGHPVRLSCPSRRPDKPYDLVSDGPDGEPLGLDRVELRNTPHPRALVAKEPRIMNESTELCLRARIARARRAAARGVTLIEVLIVVAILSLIAAGVTVAVFPKLNEANVKTTEGNAREIRNAVQRWRGLKGGTDCPTISQLVQDKEIDSASKTDDAWGVPYKITCTEDDVIVFSSGPDKKEGTKDDISVPKGTAIPKLDVMAFAPIAASGSRAEGRRRHRAFTLIEVMVVVVIGASLMAAVVMGIGAATNAKLKGACTLVSSAIRSGYTRASATGMPQRIVLDFTQRRVWIEEGAGRMLVQEADLSKTGGADPATEAEKKASTEADRILKGPRAPKTSFKPVKNAGIADDEKGAGRELGSNIRFREVMSNHQVDVQRDGRAYIYMWPGGQTELAYIQIAKGEKPTDSDTMTLFVHPLTGRVKIVAGAKTLRVEETASEREDKTF